MRGGWKEGLTEFPVNAADELIDYGTQVLIFFDILPARHSNLDKDDFANPLRVVGEEDFKGMELLRDTFDVV
jgi:hypothetical protein